VSALSLPDAKSHLNITKPDFDTELQAAIDSAEGIIADICGPLAPTSVTDRIRVSGAYSFTLRTTPVISLTSATSIYGSSTADISQLFVSPSGVVTWRDGISRFYWGEYDVVYTAGRAAPPPALLFAVKEVLRNLWEPQRGLRAGVAAGPLPTSRDAMILGPDVLIPSRARTAMEPYVQEFGFA
jgi:hypothetical protein